VCRGGRGTLLLLLAVVDEETETSGLVGVYFFIVKRPQPLRTMTPTTLRRKGVLLRGFRERVRTNVRPFVVPRLDVLALFPTYRCRIFRKLPSSSDVHGHVEPVGCRKPPGRYWNVSSRVMPNEPIRIADRRNVQKWNRLILILALFWYQVRVDTPSAVETSKIWRSKHQIWRWEITVYHGNGTCPSHVITCPVFVVNVH